MRTLHRFTQRTDWFQIDQIAPAIYRIIEPHYREDYRCNVYLVKGSRRDMLIDTGLGLASLKAFLAPYTQDPLLICSHGHYDHLGGNFEFAERLIHPAEADIIAHPTRDNTYADPFLATKDFSSLPWEGFDALSWQPEPAPATGLLNEGDRVDLGNHVYEVLHTPGHSWGSFCLWEQSTSTLFCVDTVYEGQLFDFLSCSHVPTYIKSLQRLRQYPVKIAYPGHGPFLNTERFHHVIDSYLAQHR